MAVYEAHATYTCAVHVEVVADTEEEAEAILLRHAIKTIKAEIRDSDGGCIELFVTEKDV